MKPAVTWTGPTRTCVGCGRRDAQARMLRLGQCGKGLSVVLRRASAVCAPAGRSAYVHPELPCVHALHRSKILGKSLRTTVAKEARIELTQILEEHLRTRTFAVSATQLPIGSEI